MENKMDDERIQRLIKIGTIFESMGINSIELAQRVKEHIENCSGGRSCLEKLISKNNL